MLVCSKVVASNVMGMIVITSATVPESFIRYYPKLASVWNFQLSLEFSKDNKTDMWQDKENAFHYETCVSERFSFFPLCLPGASLVSVEDSAEASFLTYIIEPLEEKTSTFWTGLYRNVDGNFFAFDFVLFDE